MKPKYGDLDDTKTIRFWLLSPFYMPRGHKAERLEAASRYNAIIRRLADHLVCLCLMLSMLVSVNLLHLPGDAMLTVL